MTYSEASRYSEIFETISDPYALQILDFLFENRDKFNAEHLAKEVKTSESKIQNICEKLRKLTVLDKDYVEGKTVYQTIDSRYANFIEKIINAID